MEVAKSEVLKYVLQVYPQETTFGDQKYDFRKLKLMAQRHLVNTTPQMPWEYGAKHVKKWLQEKVG